MEYKERVKLSEEITQLCNDIGEMINFNTPAIYVRTASFFYCFKIVDAKTIDGSRELLAFNIYKMRGREDFCHPSCLIFEISVAFYPGIEREIPLEYQSPAIQSGYLTMTLQATNFLGRELMKQFPMDESDLTVAKDMIAKLEMIKTHASNGLVPIYKKHDMTFSGLSDG